jgi:hypothetical protein
VLQSSLSQTFLEIDERLEFGPGSVLMINAAKTYQVIILGW